MKQIRLTNTKTRTLEELHPIKKGSIKLYVCGITPYDDAHLGHGRCYVTFDVLYRLLTAQGFDVTYTRNFTDIDDKLLKKAQSEFGDESHYRKVADRYIASYHETMRLLACLAPTYEPRVTDHISQIIAFIEGLVEKGHGYVVGSDVYFDITSFKKYGALSGRSINDLEAGARVEVDENKRNPGDFALWKGAADNTFWKSPWGWGRPGWHIECSALAQEYLGETIDIHGGGQDLIFPHHENEIAQSESLSGKPFARIWMHNAFVTINEEKMSKSLGNTFFLHEIFKAYDPMIVRYYYLQHHYKTPLDFSQVGLKAAQVAYKRLVSAFESFKAQKLDSTIVQEMEAALCKDLNTPKVIGLIFENLDQISSSTQEACGVKYFLQNSLGLALTPLEDVKVITPEIEKLLAQREQARKEKNWARADEIRDLLKEKGFEVHDSKLS